MSEKARAEIGVARRQFRPAAPVPHTRDLTTLGVLIELSKNPIAAFGARAYREPYIYSRTWVQDFLMVNHPDGVRHVLLDNADNYVKSRQFQRLTRPALGNGLVNAEGASWRFQRRTVAPMFQLRHVQDFAGDMAEAAAEMVARWSALPESSLIDAADEMTRLTYDIISRTMFSRDVAMDYQRMSEALALYLETQGRFDVLGAIGVPQWVPTPSRLKARGPLSYFQKELRAVIARRRAQLERGGAAPNDLLTLLLTTRDPEGGALFGEAEVFDNVMTFVFAGHETTANLLAWALYLLSESPEWDARLAQESQDTLDGRAAGAEDISRLVLTRMVLDETLRLYPPAPLVSRDSVGRDSVGGIGIEGGTSVLISPWVLHRHKALWRDPDIFDPERFAPGRKEQIARFAYIPFGAGPRVCIGMGFSLQEATIILATILRRFRLELAGGFPVVPQARLTLRPKHGLKMTLTKR